MFIKCFVGTEKVYLSEYYALQSTNTRKAKVQQDITKFFTNQIDDFKDWENYYASKVAELTGEVSLLKQSIQTNNGIYSKNTSLLNPLIEKYGTDNASEFQGQDKTNGIKWTKEKYTAKHAISDAWSRISVKRMFIETYTRLMNHSGFCGNMVQRIANNCLSS